MAFGTKALLPVALTVMVATAAGAQQKCQLDENKFAKTVLSLQLAHNAKTPEDAQKNLKNAMKELTAKADNPAERNYFIGQTLAQFLADPTGEVTMKRGDLGYATNPEQTVDLVAAIDSAYTAAAQAKPECATEINAARRTQAWAKLVNAGYEKANGGDLDAAERFAHRAMTLDKSTPYAHEVLAIVAQQRQQIPAATAHWKTAIEVAGSDTAYNDVKQRSYLNIAAAATAAADTAKGDAKVALAGQARDAYNALLKEFPTGAAADAARRGLVEIAVASGDQSAIKGTYAKELANPSAFDYSALLTAGVTAARAQQTADAVKLFEGAYAQNAYHRDILYDLARTYVDADQAQKALPLIERLLQVDPSNGDNYRLNGLAYATIQRGLQARSRDLGKKANGAKSAAAKKAYIDSAKVLGDSIPKVTNTALRYAMIADSLAAKVTFTDFSPSEAKTTVGGTITNNTSTPQSYTIAIDMLDKTGKTVSTQSTTVGPVAPGKSGRFSVVGTGAGIVAFKYAPIVKVPDIK